MQKKEKTVTFHEFITSVTWITRFTFSILPWATVVRIFNKTFFHFSSIINAYVLAWMIDYLSKQTLSQDVFGKNMLVVLGVFLGVAIISAFLSDLNYYIDIFTRMKSRPAFYKVLYEKLQGLHMEEIENAIVADKLYRAKENVNEYFDIVSSLIDVFPQYLKVFVLFLIIWKILPIPVVILILLVIPRYFTQVSMLKELHMFDKKTTQTRRIAEDNVSILFNTAALHEVKMQHSYEYFGKKYFDVQEQYNNEYLGMTAKRYAVSYSFVVLNYLAIGIAIWNLGTMLSTGSITVGMFSFYLTNIIAFSSSVSSVLLMTASLFERVVKLQDVRDIIQYKSSYPDGKEELGFYDAPDIELKDVTFTYPNGAVPVLENVSLHIKKGEKIAIVGANGAGKTTLIRLLLRLYQPKNGEILVNGIPLSHIKISTWYDRIGVLFQEYNTYPHLTVADNVRVGDLKKTDNPIAISTALEQADALNFVSHYPKGIYQLLSEKYTEGIRPSTGQWQKIAIARFMFRNPQLVIFDEPTASIDALSEAKIFDTIFKQFAEKTVIIISHRFSTVRNADRIIVLKDGTITEQGSHEKLMQLNGTYAQSFNLQAKGYSS